MPCGIHSALEVFHKWIAELLYDIDDILVWGRTIEEHDERLEQVLQRAKQGNLRLNPDKCQIRRIQVLYIGLVLTGEGIKPDESKLKALTEMPVPEDKHGIQQLLGMVNYVAKFAPQVWEVIAHLRHLL